MRYFLGKNRKVTKLILGGLLLLNLTEGSDQISWIDNNNTVHKNSFVSESAVKNMVISSGKLASSRETRIIIKQGWGCLALENDWNKKDYKVIDNNTAVLNVGYKNIIGSDLGFNQDNTKSFFILGKRGCKLLNNSEHWTVEQKNNGSWVAVASGVFTYIK